jgi:hypothetical protein
VRWNCRLRLTTRPGDGLPPVTRTVPSREAAFGVAAAVAMFVVVDRWPNDRRTSAVRRSAYRRPDKPPFA